jgi:hypothetical protein
MGGGMEDLLNPAEYAKSVVSMEFDPVIGGLTRDIRQQRAQGEQNIADITSWFKQLEDTRAKGAQANVTNSQAAIDDLARLQQGITTALGGGAAPGVGEGAGYQGISLAGLKGLQASQAGFDQNMQTILAAQANDARTFQQRGQQQVMDELISKRSDLFKQKGTAYSKAMQDALQARTSQRGQNIQQMAALQSLQLAREMAPYDLANASASLDLKKQQFQQQGAQFNQNQRQNALDYQIKKAQYDDFVASLGDEGKTTFADLTPKDRLGLSESIRSMAAGSPGNVAAMRAINLALRSAGFNPNNSQVKQFAQAILRSLPGYKPNRKKK